MVSCILHIQEKKHLDSNIFTLKYYIYILYIHNMLNFYKILTFNLVITFIYAIVYQQIKDQFYGLDSDSSFLDCLYFSFTIQSTVGFGEIGPKTKTAKLIVMTQQLVVISELSALFVKSEASSNLNDLVSKKIFYTPQIFKS